MGRYPTLFDDRTPLFFFQMRVESQQVVGSKKRVKLFLLSLEQTPAKRLPEPFRKVRVVNYYMTKLDKPVSRETFSAYRHYRKTIVVTLFNECISLRPKGTRKEKAYELPIAHLMDDLCRREARRQLAERVKKDEMPWRTK
jgi:hypothetical protein